MPRPVSAIDSIFQHPTALVGEPECYRPERCVNCGCTGLWSHGCYERNPRCQAPIEHLKPIPIPRFLCRQCGRTCSTLPSCLSPQRWYAWAVQQLALVAVFTGRGDERAAEAAGVHPSTAKRWRRWLQRRHELSAFALCRHWPALGYVADWRGFWRECLDRWGLAEAMRRLHVDGFAVP